MKKEKKNKGSPNKKQLLAAKKFESELPEVARRLNIRVSNPYGYYPEDVDKIILRLEKDISTLEKENKQLSTELHDYKNKASALQNELTQIKMQVSLMEIPDVSTEESFAMLSRVGTITGNNEEIPNLNEVDEIEQPTEPLKTIKTVETKPHSTNQPKTYSNLVKPKIKL